MAANQTEHSTLEQRSVMKFLTANHCKQYEIYRRMVDVYEEECFHPPNFYKWDKHGFSTMSQSQKDNPWNGNTQTIWWVKNIMLIIFGNIKDLSQLISLKMVQLQTVVPTANSFCKIHLYYWITIQIYISMNMYIFPGKGIVSSPTSQCDSYWKGNFRVALDYG